jgi:2-iminobutanoate/2-iminopropanoate deaminase
MKKIISTDRAPAAVGPYSQAVRAGGFLFGSGQIPLMPGTGDLAGDTIEVQTRQVLENIRAVLSGAGLLPEHVVRTECYLKDMDDFGAFNSIYAEFFPTDPPARSCVQVSRLPKDVLVEIAYTAVIP